MEERLGFIRDKLDIKILTLFVMKRLPEPVTFETLCELVVTCDDAISYFDFAECVAELVATGHLSTDGHRYSLTEKGRRNGEITENSLPFSVRIKAEKNASEARLALIRKSLVKTGHTIDRKGGYIVELSMSDGFCEVISMRLYAASEEQAVALEKGFEKNAERIYNAIVSAILSGD